MKTLALFGATDNIMASFRAALPEARERIVAQLKSLGADATKVELAAPGSNTLQAEATLSVETTIRGGLIAYEMKVPFQMGKIMLSEALISAAFNDAKKAFTEAPAMLASSPVPTMEIDLTKVTAQRAGELVIYSSEELPTWQFHAAVDSLKNPTNHKLIAQSLVASIRGNCLSDFHRVAAFKQQEFALPMVREEVKPTVVAAEVPGFRPADFTPAAVEERLTGHNLVAYGSQRPEARPTGEVQAENRRFAFESQMRSPIEAAALSHVKAKLKGDLGQVLATDLSAMRQRIDGLAAGKALVSVRFFADNNIVEAELELPFQADGKIDAEKVTKSAKSLEAEKARAEELRILSEQEAKAQLDAYMEGDKVRAALLVQGGTAQGANSLDMPAVERVPILKAMLPAETKPGDKFELRGYVYEVAATNFNSPDVEHSAFWMLCKTADLPGKFPSLGLWG